MKKLFLLISTVTVCSSILPAQSDISSQIVENTFQDFSEAQTSRVYGGSFLPELKRNADVKGSRYLFNTWMQGTVVDTSNRTIKNTGYLFNYDKIEKGLMFTKDKQTVYEVSAADIKSFTLQKDNEIYIFESFPSINNGNFVQQLVKGNRYILYKSVKTKFIKSDYYTDGLVERGNPDDQYLDENGYYVMTSDGKNCSRVELKKKILLETLNTESVKVKAYFSKHKYEDVDEDFLKGLVVFLNE